MLRSLEQFYCVSAPKAVTSGYSGYFNTPKIILPTQSFFHPEYRSRRQQIDSVFTMLIILHNKCRFINIEQML